MFSTRLFLASFLASSFFLGNCARAESVSLADSSGLVFERYAASGQDLLLWMASERGLSEAETDAARKLARQGVEVWQWDVTGSYFLPALPGSMDQVPVEDEVRWMKAALGTGKRVKILAIARAAKPVMHALATLPADERSRLCVALFYPNLYANAEPLDEPAYLDLGRLDGGHVLLLQPKRSAATPWLPVLMRNLMNAGITLQTSVLDKLREGFWDREDATPTEVEAGKRLDALLLQQFRSWECGK